MNYNFLNDEQELADFIDHHLPEPTEDECFLVILAARRKYLKPEEKEAVQLGGADVCR